MPSPSQNDAPAEKIPTLSLRRMIVAWVTLPIWTGITLTIASTVPGGRRGEWLAILGFSIVYAAAWRLYIRWRQKRVAAWNNGHP